MFIKLKIVQLLYGKVAILTSITMSPSAVIESIDSHGQFHSDLLSTSTQRRAALIGVIGVESHGYLAIKSVAGDRQFISDLLLASFVIRSDLDLVNQLKARKPFNRLLLGVGLKERALRH